jgi:hypothetical protein
MPALATARVLTITVRPPWSHWLAAGVKPLENRTWQPPRGWRGQLVIHAGKTLDPEGFSFGARLGHHISEDDVSRGEFLAVAKLVDVHRAGPDCRDACTDWGQPGCFHWMLQDIRRLVTIEGRGRQRLFIPPDDVLEQIAERRPGW